MTQLQMVVDSTPEVSVQGSTQLELSSIEAKYAAQIKEEPGPGKAPFPTPATESSDSPLIPL